MNTHYDQIKKILFNFRAEYNGLYSTGDVSNSNTPITERDIVSELYCSLKEYCKGKKISIHTEIKPAPSENISREHLKKLPKIDLVILQNNWVPAAVKIQNKYNKGLIEARFGAVPYKYFHTAIEVKIQSNVSNSKKDIDTLANIRKKSKSCNCYMVLLNARGRKKDHEKILEYADQHEICLVEHTNTK